MRKQTEAIILAALNACRAHPGVNPAELRDMARVDLRKIVDAFPGYWVAVPPDGDLEWRDGDN